METDIATIRKDILNLFFIQRQFSFSQLYFIIQRIVSLIKQGNPGYFQQTESRVLPAAVSHN